MSNLTLTIWIAVIIVVLILAIYIAIYNGLQKAKVYTDEAWSQIDVQLKRRNDLIPNLVETTKGYAKHESETLEKVVQLRNQLTNIPSDDHAETLKVSNQLSALYDQKLLTFPSNIVAGIHGFKKVDYLQTAEAEKEVPKVKF